MPKTIITSGLRTRRIFGHHTRNSGGAFRFNRCNTRRAAECQYGIGRPDGIDWATRNRVHVGGNAPAEVADSGRNSLHRRFAYGDLSYGEAAGSLEMFVEEVLPHFK